MKVKQTNEYICDVCGMSFSKEETCREHENTHVEKNAYCEVVPAKFQVGDIVEIVDERKVYHVAEVRVEKDQSGYQYVYVVLRYDEEDRDNGGWLKHWCWAGDLRLVADKVTAESVYDEVQALLRDRLGIALEDFVATV